MGASETFELIKSKIEAGPDMALVNSFFFEQVFGNFLISFEDRGSPKSIVLDRGTLLICSDLEGESCSLALKSIYEHEAEDVLLALKL